MAGTATFTYNAVDITGIPYKGEIVGSSKQAVTEELKGRGLTVQKLEEKASGLSMEINLGSKKVKAADLTIMTRQLSVMVSSGMTLLRAFYVLEEQVEHPKLKETLAQGPRGHRGRPHALRRARAAPEGLQPALRRDGPRRRDRRHPRGHAAARRHPARGRRLPAPPGQVGDDLPGGRALLRGARADRADRLHRPRLRRRLQGLRRRAARDHQVHRRALARLHRTSGT